MAKVLSVSTNKGGVLKTSITTNLAGVISKTKKVLIVDGDSQGNCALSFGISPRTITKTLYDVLINRLPPEAAIINVHENIDLLPCNSDLSHLDRMVYSNPKVFPDPAMLLKNALEHLKTKYDVILVDTPPSLALAQANALNFVDSVIIPFHPEEFSRVALIEMVEFIEDIQETFKADVSIAGVIGTLVDLRLTLHKDELEDCKQYCEQNGIPMFKTYIPRATASPSAVAYRRLPQTLVDSDQKHPVVIKYNNLAREVGVIG